ncbi:MAG: DNRLRE domain-containing protein [Thermoplasmata archaeon]|nr:DNRLRE domain-containing protein [Thermoplasmata archaeon]
MKLTRAFLILVVSSLLAAGWGVNADPAVTDNGNGTTTAVWSFQNTANYTSQNLSLAPSNATLQREGSLWLDTSLVDFLQGTGFYNVNLTMDPGNVTLDNTSLADPPDTLEVSIDQGSGRDAYIDEWFDTKNYGASETLVESVDGSRILVQFDTSLVTNAPWVSKSEVWLKTSALSGGISANLSVHKVLTSWVEGTGSGQPSHDGATWLLTDGSNYWAIPGGDFDSAPEHTVIGVNQTQTWYQWDVTQLLLEWLNGTTPNNGVIFTITFSGMAADDKVFFSKEYASPSERPKLVTYYNSTGPGYANGTFVSRIMDAQSSANWANISWNATMPADTNLSLHTRSGDCMGNWSPWSQPYGVPSGSQITSPPDRCIQYKTEMGTYNQTRKPSLEEVRIDSWQYAPRGIVETEDLQPSNLISWDIFDSLFSLPLGTNIAFSYSADSGMSWIPVMPGENLSVVVSPKMRFKANLTTSDTSVSPTLLNMTMTYVHIGPLDHIHMSLAAWTGTVDDTVDLNATGHDVFHNVVTFTQFWSTTDPTGAVDVNGVYSPGTVGAWRVYCNNSDNSVFNFTEVNVTVGSLASIDVTPNPVSVIVGDAQVFDAQGYDAKGNPFTLTNASWSTNAGYLSNTTSVMAELTAQATPLLGGWVNASEGGVMGSAVVDVVAGPLDHIHMSVATWAGTADDTLDLDAVGHDALHNVVTFIQFWSTTDPTGTVDANGVYDPGTVGAWRVYCNNSDDSISNYTDVTISAGSLASIDVAPNPVTLVVGDVQVFTAQGYDGDGNPFTLTTTAWSTNVGMISNASAATATLTAQQTPHPNGWVNASEGGVVGSAVVDVVIGPLDHIHMSMATWTGTVDDTVDLDAVGHDVFHNVVTFTQFWSTTDPTGAVDVNGVYSPGTVGTWRVYCNNSDDSVSNYTTVNVLPGPIFRIAIDPWDPGTLTTDDMLTLNVTAYDSKGNSLGPVLANWTVNGGIGTVTPGPDSTAVFDPTTPGIGTITADDGIGHTNTTNTIVVVVGSGFRIGIEPWSPGTLTADDSVNFTAYSYDTDGNMIGPANVTWAVNGGIGTIPAGPSEASVFEATTIGTGTVSIDNGLGHTNTTDTIQVLVGSRFRIGIEPWSPGTLTADDSISFMAYSYDADGNLMGLASVSWSVNGGIGTIPTGPSVTSLFEATTVGVGTVSIDDGLGHANTTDWITVTAGSLDTIQVQPDPAVIEHLEYQDFTAAGFDADGNTVAIVDSVWETNAGTVTYSLIHNATLRAQDTSLLNGWIRVTATLQNNITGTANVSVVVTTTNPVIQGTVPNQLRPEDYGSWSLDLSAFASDPQDPLSNLTWYFTDHDPSLTTISGDNVIGNHVMSFTTVSNMYGSDELTIWLRDKDGHSDSQTLFINITSVNDRPTIDTIASFTLHYDVPYTYNFYDYVSDVETPKESLTLTSDDPDHISFNGLWGTFTYPEDYLDLTVYPVVTVHDEDGGEMSTLLAITVSDDYVPVLVLELPDVVLFEGEEILGYFDLDDYFLDPDGDSLFYSSGNIHVDITINEDHTVDFKAPSDWSGQETVTFKATDPSNARAEDIVLVTVLPVNDPPTISGVPDLVVHYDDVASPLINYTFDLMPYVHDVDNDTSDLLITANDPSHIFFYGGQTTVMYIYYPVGLSGQTFIVRITVSDGLEEAFQDINITVMDDRAPEIVTPIPDVTFDEDMSLPDAFRLDDHFSDPDGDDLAYSSSSTNILISIDPLTSLVSFSAVQDWFGMEYVTFRATDTHGAMNEQTVEVTVLPVNDAPEILNIPDMTIDVDRIHTLDLTQYVYDIDNSFSELTIIVVGDYTGTPSVAGPFIVFDYPREGTDYVLLEVSDGNLTAYATFVVRIVGEPDPSVWDQVYWPWWIVIALLLSVILVAFTRRFVLKIQVQEAFLIHESGNLIDHTVIEGTGETDEWVFSDMLAAVQQFIEDSFIEAQDAPVKKIEFREQKILVEKGQHTFLGIVYRGSETRRNTQPIRDAMEEIERTYGDELDGSKGPMSGLPQAGEILRKHLGG